MYIYIYIYICLHVCIYIYVLMYIHVKGGRTSTVSSMKMAESGLDLDIFSWPFFKRLWHMQKSQYQISALAFSENSSIFKSCSLFAIYIHIYTCI